MSTQPAWLERVVEAYSNDNEHIVEEYTLPPVELLTLQRLWGQPPSDPMVEMFEVTETQRAFIEELIGVTLDFAANAYFLSAYASDLDAARRDGGFMGLYPPPRQMVAFPDAARVVPKGGRPTGR